MNQHLTLPPYQVRKSKRAKHARLVMNLNGIVEVVLPNGYCAGDAEILVRQHLDWIENQKQRLKAHKQPVKSEHTFPASITFFVLNETVAIRYQRNDDTNGWDMKNGALTVFMQHERYSHEILQNWLKRRAAAYLPHMLAEIALEMGETYTSVSIRLQKTRWGSCSSQRRINLNAKLLLLPKSLVRYVMVHELAHLQHLNHSAAFWQRVREFVPDYSEQRKALHAWEKVAPDWLLPSDYKLG